MSSKKRLLDDNAIGWEKVFGEQSDTESLKKKYLDLNKTTDDCFATKVTIKKQKMSPKEERLSILMGIEQMERAVEAFIFVRRDFESDKEETYDDDENGDFFDRDDGEEVECTEQTYSSDIDEYQESVKEDYLDLFGYPNEKSSDQQFAVNQFTEDRDEQYKGFSGGAFGGNGICLFPTGPCYENMDEDQKKEEPQEESNDNKKIEKKKILEIYTCVGCNRNKIQEIIIPASILHQQKPSVYRERERERERTESAVQYSGDPNEEYHPSEISIDRNECSECYDFQKDEIEEHEENPQMSAPSESHVDYPIMSSNLINFLQPNANENRVFEKSPYICDNCNIPKKDTECHILSCFSPIQKISLCEKHLKLKNELEEVKGFKVFHSDKEELWDHSNKEELWDKKYYRKKNLHILKRRNNKSRCGSMEDGKRCRKMEYTCIGKPQRAVCKDHFMKEKKTDNII